ncbi:MAG: hypothetical protein KC766_39750 [Myxococcales bacterium]|nr:hypothetical protein [Myxococcales bacterium]
MLSKLILGSSLLAAVALGVGCGGDASGSGSSRGSGGEGNHATGGKGGDDGHNWSAGGNGGATGGAGGGWTVAGGPGVGGNGPNCFDQPPSWDTWCGDSFWDDEACSYQVSCGGEPVELTYVCRGAAFELLGTPCSAPFESCAQYDLICDGVWKFAYTRDCPQAFVQPGDACSASYSYACDVSCPNGPKSRAFRCVGPEGQRRWETDDVCD